MVPPAGTPLRTDRVRALNLPVPVVVVSDGEGLPVEIVEGSVQGGRAVGRSGGTVVAAIEEVWKVHDEWWRTPIERRYFDVVLESGAHVVLFEDLTTSQWYLQMP